MISILQPKREAVPRIGIVTTLMVLWLVMFCHHCLAAAGVPPDTAGKPAAPCQHDKPEIPSGGKNSGPKPGDCLGQCDAGHASVVPQTGFNDKAYLKQSSSGEPDIVLAANIHVAVTTRVDHRVHAYERSHRSYFLPFERYTVLLN